MLYMGWGWGGVGGPGYACVWDLLMREVFTPLYWQHFCDSNARLDSEHFFARYLDNDVTMVVYIGHHRMCIVGVLFFL